MRIALLQKLSLRLLSWLTLAAICSAPAAAQSNASPGLALYQKHCAGCHDQVSPRVPPRTALENLSPSRILRTMDFGLMMSVAYALKRDEREAVAHFLGKGQDAPPPPASAFCKADRPILAGKAQPSWANWSPESDNARYQPASGTSLDAVSVPQLELKWAYGFAGDVIAFAAPTIVKGTLFVGSAGGAIQAMDAETGCLYWIYQANGPVRSAIAVWDAGTQMSLVFSDQNGWAYAIDAHTGTQRWVKRVEPHEAARLTASAAIHNGIAYIPAASWEETRTADAGYPCCTFRGSVSAVRISDGAVLWKTWLVKEPKKTGVNAAGNPTYGPSGAGVWSTPTIDIRRGALYVTTGDNYSHPATSTSDALVALDIKSGKIRWVRQTTANDVFSSACSFRDSKCGPDHDFGSPAILVHLEGGKDILIAGQKSGIVYAFDPDARGKILWQMRVGKGGTGGGVQWGMASDGRQVYASVSDIARVRPEGAPDQPPTGRPAGGARGAAGMVDGGGPQFDPRLGGGLTALNIADGNKVWFAQPAPCNPPRTGCSPAQSGAVSAIPGVVFSGSLDGHIRAFAAADGRVLWDFNTEQTFSTVNGEPARGGSLDGSGAVIVGDMVYVNSGYPRFGGAPGNVLLAFGLKPRQP